LAGWVSSAARASKKWTKRCKAVIKG
jgi:hypothetical protein